jgi:hypothetical protein
LKFSNGRANSGENNGDFRTHEKPPAERHTIIARLENGGFAGGRTPKAENSPPSDKILSVV